MSTKVKIIIVVASLVIAFAVGRYTSPVKVKTEVKTVEAKHEVEDTTSNQNKHKETTKTETVRPDGTKETVTKTIEDTKKNTDTKDMTQTDTNKTETKEVEYRTGRLNLSLLGGYDLSVRRGVVGGMASKEILGPLTIGVFGLSNSTVGASIGLSF